MDQKRAGWGFVLSLLAGVTGAAEDPPKKVLAEPKPDQALVYVMRPDGPGLTDKVGSWVFSENTVVAHLKGSSYAFAYLPPGRQLIWGRGAREVELVPGQVYYLRSGLDANVVLMGEEEGKAFLDTIKNYRPLTAEDRTEGEKKTAKDLEKVKTSIKTNKYFAERRADVEEVPAPVRPPNADVLLQIPRYAPVKIELMQTVTSKLNKPGETVWFRVAEDAVSNEKVWLASGTPVKGVVSWVDGSGGGGKSGSLEIRIPALPGSDGRFIPVVGQLLSAAKARAGAASVGFALGGLLGNAMVKGREDYQLAGEPFRVFTRHDAWSAPVADRAALPAEPQAFLTVKPVQPLRLAPASRDVPGPVALLVETDQPIQELTLIEVGGWKIPDPPKSIRVERQAGGAVATFQGWELLRHLRPSGEPMPLRFRATRAQGEPLMAQAMVAWKPEE